jgi:hypothetical protein
MMENNILMWVGALAMTWVADKLVKRYLRPEVAGEK